MSAENNNAMTTITKNPLISLIVVVVIIGIIVLVVKMSGSEEAFSQSSDKIVENYPQSTPMNVMYSDANGNLGTTTDLGLQNLTVSGDSTFANNNVIINSGDIGGPGAQTRVNSQGIIFGGANNGREASSAQITAGRHDANALCIVGMSDADKKNRRIHTWAEGGTINEGEIASRLTGVGQFRAAAGDYGTIFRQDGENFHVLTTKKGDPMGGWSDPVRPLYINNASGDVTMSQKLSVGGTVSAGSVNTGGAVSSNRLVIGGDLSGERAISVNKATGDWNTQISNPTSGVNVYMAHGGKYGMHINANNKDMDTYALECYGGDKELMRLTGKGNMTIGGRIYAGGRDILDQLDALQTQVNNCIPNGQRVQLRSYDANRFISENNGGAEVRGHRDMWSRFNIEKA